MVIGLDFLEPICRRYANEKIQFVLSDIKAEKDIENILSRIDITTDKIGVLYSDTIIPIQQIQQAVDMTNDIYRVCPYDRSYKMDVLPHSCLEKLFEL